MRYRIANIAIIPTPPVPMEETLLVELNSPGIARKGIEKREIASTA
ncbi:MAG: hypothetical protein ACRD93_03330 [Nitrososphaeraceae archaeon]